MIRNLESYTEAYDQLPFEPMQEKLRKSVLMSVLKESQSGRLLEVGCGRESFLWSYENFESATIVEPTKEFANRNRSLVLRKQQVRIVELTVEEFAKEATERFDVCIASSLLHEVQSPSAVLEACHRLLVPNGILVVNVPNAHSLHRIIGVALGLQKSVFEISSTQEMMQQLGPVFSTESLAALLHDCGFEVTTLFTDILKLLKHEQLDQLLKKNAITETTILELNKFSRSLPEFGSEIFAVARSLGEIAL